jgi:hypothetical protein
MPSQNLARKARAVVLGLALAWGGPAAANIDLPGGDTVLDGSFQGLTYGTAGVANLTPLLYIGDFGATEALFTQIIGTGLEVPVPAPAWGGSVVTVTYSVTNNDFASFTDLRLMLDLKAKGQPGSPDTAVPVGFGSSPVLGDPDAFQIFDFAAPGDSPIQRIRSADGLNGSSAASCATGCYSDLALQWNLDELDVGETWQVSVMLVDDPSLVIGGRYLVANSLGPDGNQIFFGNPQLVPEPQTYAMLLAGLTLLAFLRMRKS